MLDASFALLPGVLLILTTTLHSVTGLACHVIHAFPSVV